MPCLSRFLLVLAALALATPAAARSNCPSPYDDNICAVLGSNPCSFHSNPDEYRCTNFGYQTDKLWLVSDETKVWAWGTKKVGRWNYEFCCNWSHLGDVPPAVVDMDNGNNEVRLVYGSTENYAGSSEIVTGDGNDTIYGSNYDDCDWPCDEIFPNDGEDYVEAGAGNDTIFCYSGDTTDGKQLKGGYGHDKILGSGADDEIWGNDEDDWIIGFGGGDWISGGDDIDSIYGGYGGDEMYNNLGDYYAREWQCGEQGADDCNCSASWTLCAMFCDCGVGGEDTCNEYGQQQPEHLCPEDPEGFWYP